MLHIMQCSNIMDIGDASSFHFTIKGVAAAAGTLIVFQVMAHMRLRIVLHDIHNIARSQGRRVVSCFLCSYGSIKT